MLLYFLKLACIIGSITGLYYTHYAKTLKKRRLSFIIALILALTLAFIMYETKVIVI